MADPSETTRTSRVQATVAEDELLGAVRALATQVGELQAEVQSLRSDRRMLPQGDVDVPGWDIEAPARRDGSAWMRSVASPAARRPAVPRLFLEILFLVGVACLAAVARLDTALVVVVMAGAWGLVALAEWTAERAVRLSNEAAFGGYGTPGEDRSWFTPPQQQTLEIETGEDASKLPPPSPGA